MAAIYISIILLLRIFQSYFTKRSSSLVPDRTLPFFNFALFMNVISAVLGAFLLMIEFIGGAKINFTMDTLVYACISGISFVAAIFGTVFSMKSGIVVLSSLFATAGILMPVIFGLFHFNEEVSIIQFIAFGLFIVAASLLILSSKKHSGKFKIKTLIFLLLVTVANGTIMLMQKSFGIFVQDGNVTLFSFLTFISASILLFLVIAIMRLKQRYCKTDQKNDETTVPIEITVKTKFDVKLLIFGAILAVAMFVINQLATLTAALVSSIILFGLINGGEVLIAFLVGAVSFKEKITVKGAIGVTLGIVSLIVINMGAI